MGTRWSIRLDPRDSIPALLSIFATLREMLFLWLRNFWWLAAITLCTGWVGVTGFFKQDHPDHSPSPTIPLLRFTAFLIGFFLILLFQGIRVAAILALLKPRPLEQTPWKAIQETVKKFAWTLSGVFFNLGLIGAGVILAIAYLLSICFPHRTADSSKFVYLFVIGIYLFFIKYALAYPLVVVEYQAPGSALRKSWRMTKGHFWYVGGCYLFLWATLRLVQWLVPIPAAGSPFIAEAPLLNLGWQLLDTMWIILSWCMYLRITETDRQSFENTTAGGLDPSAAQDGKRFR
jgi:membrane-anchored glycerophosphoryl diester phosphodiesterase (GDPDase)